MISQDRSLSQEYSVNSFRYPKKLDLDFIFNKIYFYHTKWKDFEKKINSQVSHKQKIFVLKKAIKYLKFKITDSKNDNTTSCCNTDILYIYRFSKYELMNHEEISQGVKFINQQIEEIKLRAAR